MPHAGGVTYLYARGIFLLVAVADVLRVGCARPVKLWLFASALLRRVFSCFFVSDGAHNEPPRTRFFCHVM